MSLPSLEAALSCQYMKVFVLYIRIYILLIIINYYLILLFQVLYTLKEMP